jgi:MFS transporter, PPP family, 3-phenylpropionic acid transporter
VQNFAHFSRFYFFYYAALGAYSPYIGRWVDSQGYAGEVVGIMLGLWYASRIFGPPLWTWHVQKQTQPGHWLVIGSVLTLCAFAGFLFTNSLWPMLAVMAVFGFCYNALMPQFEAMTLKALEGQSHRYGQIRVWGSIGFLRHFRI